METDYHFKIVLVGDMDVGKSSLVLRYTDECFTVGQKSTIGVDFKLKTLDIGKDGLVKLQIWDTGGQERFMSIGSSFFDVTDKKSFEHAIHWLRESQYKDVDVTNSCGLLVGNKIDKTMERGVSFEEGELHKPKDPNSQKYTGLHLLVVFVRQIC